MQQAIIWQDKLWPHQIDAVDTVRRYLRSDSRKEKAALVRMPTGSGKTGIIAVLAKRFEEHRHVLVVSPFAALRRQAADQIRERFWHRVGLDVPAPTKSVHVCLPSNAAAVLDRTVEQGVYVCTIQTLQALQSQEKYRAAYALLKERTSLVLFDEGHREPALQWAKAIRALEKPTVLFTATPYRNDYKLLRVDARFTSVLSLAEAIQDRFIRNVEFREVHFANAEEFVTQLLEFYQGEFQTLKPVEEARVIIRCENRDSVDAIKSLIQNRGHRAIAIHDTFEDDEEEGHYQTVPDAQQEPARSAVFWVHQNKLIEGIDNPAFCLLAIYEALGNGRSLVQQVGRVLRNVEREPDRTAYVMCHRESRQLEYWENYRSYEQQADTPGLADFVTRMATQNLYAYLEGNFRQPFDMEANDAYKALSYRLSANVFSLDQAFDLDVLHLSVREDWVDLDRERLNSIRIDDHTGVCLYLTLENSPLLREHVFLEVQLGYTIYRRVGNLLFFYDSSGALPEYLRERRRLSPAQLSPLFGQQARISQVSLANSDLGKYSIRRRSIAAYDISDTAPSLGDNAQICSTATGSVELGNGSRVRRYVGFSKAKITDRKQVVHNYADFIQWVDDVADRLTQAAPARHPLFRRFSIPVDPPARDTEPVNILLDLDEAQDMFRPRASNEPLQVEERCQDVGADGSLTIVANNTPFQARFSYDTDKRQYLIRCLELESAYIATGLTDARKYENLVSYLNREQAFRVVPQARDYVYAHGHFFMANLGLNENMELVRLLKAIPEMNGITSEKGGRNSATATGWAANSLFGLIATKGLGTTLEADMRSLTALVCDDLGNEIADFIAVDEAGRRVIFIHAKKGESSLSASQFADVCSQAVKNLGYLGPNPPPMPDQNLEQWNGNWSVNSIGTVRSRIFHAGIPAAEMWSKIQSLLRDPSASREVWIVMCNGLSVQRFTAELGNPNRAPQVIQIYHQLASTWASVSSVGARLRIFCSE